MTCCPCLHLCRRARPRSGLGCSPTYRRSLLPPWSPSQACAKPRNRSSRPLCPRLGPCIEHFPNRPCPECRVGWSCSSTSSVPSRRLSPPRCQVPQEGLAQPVQWEGAFGGKGVLRAHSWLSQEGPVWLLGNLIWLGHVQGKCLNPSSISSPMRGS